MDLTNNWWGFVSPSIKCKAANRRLSTIESLKILGDSRCCYSGGEWIARRCDCKYGGPKGGEQTGCPELRDTVYILSRLSDDEWEAAYNRKNVHEYFIDEDLSTWAKNNGWIIEKSNKNNNKYFWTKGSYCIYVDWDGNGVPAINEKLRNILSHERQMVLNL